VSSNRIVSRNVRLACSVALSMLLLAAAGSKSEASGQEAMESPQRGGTAVVGSITDVDSWNEYVSKQAFANGIHRRIYLRLAQELGDTRDHPASFEPLLAESWTFSRDRKAITFRLRDAVWSDGGRITASDVRFTWLAQTSPEVAWLSSADKRHVTDVEVVDDRTVVFHFDRAYPYQLSDAVEGGILPEHVFGTVPFEEWRTHDWSDVHVGSGPFVLERYAPGEEIVLARNPRYFRKGYPLLDKIVVRIVPDATTLLTQVLAGAIDYMEGVAPREAGRIRGMQGARLIAFDYPMYDFIGWNQSRSPFDDPEIRKAMTLAIDRGALVDELLYGYGRVSRGPLLSFWWASDASLEPWPYDPVAARRILASKGYAPRAGDGVLARGGKPLEFEIVSNAGNRLREAAMVKIQEQLSRIGVRVRVSTLEMQTLVHRTSSGEFDAYLGGWKMLGNIDLKPIFGSASAPPAGNNVVRYRSAEVDDLLDRIESVSDWTSLRPFYSSIERAIRRDQPYTFLYETERLAVAARRLGGTDIDVPSDSLAHLERWWIRP
jgi:peptide/nickel transport system substrate-binding protein